MQPEKSTADLPFVCCTGDIVLFAQQNVPILHYLLQCDLSKVTVGFVDPSKWCDYMSLKRTKPDMFNFVTRKLQLEDIEITSLSQFIIDTSNKYLAKNISGEQLSYATDYMCNIFLNQFELNLAEAVIQG